MRQWIELLVPYLANGANGDRSCLGLILPQSNVGVQSACTSHPLVAGSVSSPIIVVLQLKNAY